MKLIGVIVVLILGLNFASSQTYKNAFKSDMCDCIETEILKRKFNKSVYNKCFKEILPKYATLIDEEIVEEDLTQKYYKGQVARKDLVVALQYELVYSCDSYFKYLEGERISKKLIARENAKESDLKRYNQQVALTPNALSYFMRAQLYFKLGKLNEAESDINKSLSVNPSKDNIRSTRKELMVLAWIYEEQERFNEAILLYDKIYIGDYDMQVAMLRALADKKSGSAVYTISKDNKTEINKEVKVISRGRETSTVSVLSEAAETTSKSNNKTTTQTTKKDKDASSLRKLLKLKD